MLFTPSILAQSSLQTRVMACAIALCFTVSAPVLAQTDSQTQTLPAVVITGARFASDPALPPIGASVISADDIRSAGVGDVNAAIRKLGGVYGRESLTGSRDFDLDLGGFGASSSQNLVVVLDGVRLSENELSSAVLSGIPIDSVERIEITRSGSSVLYGDGATGGVINIISKNPSQQAGRGSVFAEVGQFNLREARAAVAQAWEGFALDAALGELQTDNYRANGAFKQSNFSVNAQWTIPQGRAGVRLESMRQDSRFPGSLAAAEFNANPRQTDTPHDFGSQDSDRVTAFIERRVGSVDVAAELSQRDKTVKATNVFSSGPSALQYTGKQTQFSPRLRQIETFDGLLNEAVLGIDLVHWTRVTASDFSQANAVQNSKAVYLRDEIKFQGSHSARIAIGARHEVFDQNSIDPAPYTSATYDSVQTRNAWELQGSFKPAPQVELFGKTGQSYRVANVDENAYTPNANQPLAAQISHDLEFGATLGDAVHKLTARLFRHKLTNEITFSPTVDNPYGVNTNLDPTRHQGFEIEASTGIATDWNLTGHARHIQATFTEGPNAGKEIPLVPENIVSARLAWAPKDGQSADIGVQWVDRQRYGNDFDNSCAAQIPSYATVDARYAKKFGAWEVALTGLNLFDKHDFSSAYYCTTAIYPADGRQLKISARYSF